MKQTMASLLLMSWLQGWKFELGYTYASIMIQLVFMSLSHMSVPDIYTNTFCIFADGQIPFSKTDAACTGSPMLIMISTGGGHARLSKYRFTEAVIMPACVNRREKKSARGPKPVG